MRHLREICGVYVHGSQIQDCVHWWVLVLVMLGPGGGRCSAGRARSIFMAQGYKQMHWLLLDESLYIIVQL